MLLELNIKTQKDLNKYLEIISQGHYSGVSITSKKNNLELSIILTELLKIPLLRGGSKADGVVAVTFEQTNLSNPKIIPTFSCKANYNQNALETFIEFQKFLATIQQFKLNQFLLVSGNPKMKLDSAKVLNQFTTNQRDNNPIDKGGQAHCVWGDLKIAVAYNPYSKEITTENQRLIAKLQHSNVNQVWLQLGQDLEKLKEAVALIRNINPNIKIVNSILLPTKTLLKSLQFRPWSGVFYSEEFYNNLDFALQNVEQMKQFSQDLGLEILISGVQYV
jgi:5,10-methylenetetrahydrofolate reductase